MLLVPSSFLDISVISEEDPYAVALACVCTPAGDIKISALHSPQCRGGLVYHRKFRLQESKCHPHGEGGVGFGWPFPYYSHLHVLLLRAALPPVT